jgi:ABC-type branched-subunit amino acid transport system substrate-binding protein
MPDLTGPAAFIGKPYAQVVTAAFKAEGFQVSALDNPTGQSATDVTNARQLVSQHAIAIFGPLFSNDCDAAMDVAIGASTPIFCPAPDPGKFVQPNQFVFADGAPEAADAAPSLQFAAQLLHKSSLRVGVFRVDAPGAAAYEAQVRALARQRGWQVVAAQTEPVTAVDASAYASAISSANPDVVLSDANTAIDASFVQHLRGDGSKVPVIVAAASGGYGMLQQANDPGTYSLFHNDVVLPSSTAAGAKAYIAQMAQVGVKSAADLNGQLSLPEYLASRLFITAFGKCRCSGAALARTIEQTTIDVPGIAMNYGYTQQNHIPSVTASVYRWDAAKGVPVQVTANLKVPTFK